MTHDYIFITARGKVRLISMVEKLRKIIAKMITEEIKF